MQPTNITLLDPKTIRPGIFKPVTSTDAFEGMSQNLNEDGLYSVEIFGKMGSAERDKTEAFIDVKLPIFNPTYFKAMTQLKGVYLGIIKGSEYAIWDPEAKDFIKSNLLEGETGFSWFVSLFKELKPTMTDSYKRGQKIEVFERFKDIALTDKVVVIPAGLRDIQFQPNGVPIEPEITELYRSLLFRTRVVSLSSKEDTENPLYDSVRYGIQTAFNDLDEYLFSLLGGKGGFLQRRLFTRGVVGGTRNVITARKVGRADLDEDNGVSPNSVDIGLYQGLLNFQYVCIHAMLSGYLENIFTTGSQTAKLVNPKTLSYEYVEVNPQTVEKWTTATGITKLFNGFGNAVLRSKPIMISGHYMALIYVDDETVCVLNDINDLPEGKDRKKVKPITYFELYYLSCFKTISEQYSQQTRYPITGIGSIFPAEVNLVTVQGAKPRNVVDTEWNVIGRCPSFPEMQARMDYFDAMSIDPSREQGAGSDHDGDQLNSNSICAEDSKSEIAALFGKREYYISGGGRFLYDPINEPILFMLKAATSGMEV